ncbi:MAG: peptidoglycan-binding protein, partial [Gammaproteobacteria bacterium]|nr:peptidoglycan-binding protein [Gammaproteobacteria bacterium]
RLLNVLCDRSLLGTYVQNKPVVDKKTLSTAAKEVFGEIKHVQNRSKLARLIRISAIICIAAITAALVFFIFGSKANEPSTISATSTANIGPIKQEQATVETVAIGNPLIDFFLTSNANNQEIAFNALLQLWKPGYLNKTSAAVCDDTGHGLSCFQHRGNLNSLRKLNRPVVLKLYDDAGKISYLTLEHLNNNLARLYTGQDSFVIEARLLEKHWYGEFSLLWQAPPFYQQPILPGSDGEVVQWLGQQLARLHNQDTAPTIHNTYSDELVSQLRHFQQDKGLIPDGIAGPLTLIHLNTATGITTPLLYEHAEDKE